MGALAIKSEYEDAVVRIDDYPDAQAYRSGNKVSWLYYELKSDAYKAKALAETKRDRLLGKGYEFGFQWPGEVTLMKQGKYFGLYEVCIP